MSVRSETIEQSHFSRQRSADAEAPGLVLLFSAGEPMMGAMPLQGGALDLGRGGLAGVELRDGCMSRQHARVELAGGIWTVTDHGSRNGSAVDGVRVSGEVRGADLKVLRTGESLFLLRADIRPFLESPVEVKDDCVIGPHMRAVFDQIRRAAATGVLHINGETGSGKEIAARAFHRFGSNPGGPFVAVNCAAIPEGLAEGLFFGARKGSYSGATGDSEGYLVSADGGTLFLDEVGELDLDVQAKLLRVLETREVMALGAPRARKVDIRICSATHQDLRAAVSARRFREDLYYRLGRPQVGLAPLRDRSEDIPLLVDREIRRVSKKLVAHSSFVEACLLRPWPGNVRELLVETRDAATASLDANETAVRAARLGATAGMPYAGTRGPAPSTDDRATVWPERETILAALQRCQGKVATAAREVGLHRTQLRRWLEKNGVDPKQYRAPGAEDSDSRDPP